MKKNVSFIKLPVLLLLNFSSLFGQYSHNLHKVMVAPSYLTEYEYPSFDLVGSYGFVGFDGAPKNLKFSAVIPVKERSSQTFSGREKSSKPGRIFAGIIADQRSWGIHNRFQALGNFAYRLQASQNLFISFGVGAGVLSQTADWQSVLPDVGDASTSPTVRNYTPITELALNYDAHLSYKGLNFGLLASGNKFREYGAYLSWKSSGEPKNGNDNGGYYGFEESNKKRVQVEISAYYVHSEILQNQRKAVSIMLLNSIGFGVGYDYPKAVSAMSYIRFGVFRIGYNFGLFDASASAHLTKSATHEITLQYQIKPAKEDDGMGW